MPEDPRTFFGKHHYDYAVSSHHARGADLERLIAGLHAQAPEKAADVASGAGHTALKLAQMGLDVTAVDITPEMLEETRRQAEAHGLKIQVSEAPAEALPFADQSLDIVTCRRAAHHFTDVRIFLQETFRTLVPGGRLGVSDMTATKENAVWLNQLEQRRDPSHHRALSPDDWYQALVDTGFDTITIELSEEPMTLEEWLSPVAADSPSGREALSFAQTSEAPAEFIRQGLFIKRRILIWARRP
ncbi:methyltransferase domain-containing protein [Sulfobacillus sp. DSM 109850]|uniref:Methyltransferase domain-containing protein n=1 Tax=Sulfobacillus harzensis TaxID=2729629 RepID=A0A7Y0Q499_9FIRM|nr:methyltransferase domain-containing protein [Sulfobacillus harzensis]